VALATGWLLKTALNRSFISRCTRVRELIVGIRLIVIMVETSATLANSGSVQRRAGATRGLMKKSKVRAALENPCKRPVFLPFWGPLLQTWQNNLTVAAILATPWSISTQGRGPAATC
jgi:hypothetical protein